MRDNAKRCITASSDKAEPYTGVNMYTQVIGFNGICSVNTNTVLCYIFVSVSTLFRYIG